MTPLSSSTRTLHTTVMRRSKRIMAACARSHAASTPQRRQSSTASTLPDNFPKAFSRYDDTHDWREWFKAEEYRNPWNETRLSASPTKTHWAEKFDWPATLEPLNHLALDNHSKFTIQLLQDLYHVGLAQSVDRITTERSNATIKMLADDRNFQEYPGNKLIWRRAQRADHILKIMHALYVPLQARLRQENMRSPVQLPVPNHETYFEVLKLHAHKMLHGDASVPLRCHEIVEQMQERSVLDPSITPHALHWNQVLNAWANSKDADRAISAAQLLQKLDTAKHNNTAPDSNNNMHNKPLTDASSFSHALRACVSVQQRGQSAASNNDRMQTAAFKVAGQIWKVLQAHERIPTSSFHYVHYLRSCRNLPSESDQFNARIKETMTQCLTKGKFNIHILDEFLKVAPANLHTYFLGNLNIKTQGWSKEDRISLVRKLPKSWFENADGSKYTW